MGNEPSRVAAPPASDERPAGPDVLKPTLADEAYEELKRRIVMLELEPGAQFRETDIASSLGFGKTPVREALLRLGLEDLVRVQSRSGYTVAPITLKSARDLCELRALIEGEAAYRVASVHGGATEEFCAAHGKAPASSADAPDAFTLPAMVDAERGFHLDLARASGNELLPKTLAGLLQGFARLCYLAAALGSESLPVGHDHARLVDAIAGRDADQARALVVDEIRRAETQLIQALLNSESISTANVDPTPGARAQTFYLNVPTDDEGEGGGS